MKQKFDYPIVGTLELTAMDLAFINKLFAIAGHIGKHATLMKGDIELTMDMAMMVALGPQCEKMVDDLHKIHTANLEHTAQAQRDVAMDAAQVTMGMVLAAQTGRDGPEGLAEDQITDILAKAIAHKKDHDCSSCTETKCPNAPMNKAGGFNGSPETGYI